MIIIGIETSCDDTGVSIYDSTKGILSNLLYSQTSIHKKYGGIVPELASRSHTEKLTLLLNLCLLKSKVDMRDIDGIAYTSGPGLVGALLTGASFAKSLGYIFNLPTLEINHLEGHILSPFIDNFNLRKGIFPCLSLLVSGGHSMFVNVLDIGRYEVVGESIDDSAGESFDKVARMLKLGYPGGPLIEKKSKLGISRKYIFPKPMINNGIDFSFSGLKTSVMNKISQVNMNEQAVFDISLAFQDSVMNVLYEKTKRALNLYKYNKLIVCGGVIANRAIREKLNSINGISVFFPKMEYCSDNGAMIAFAGYHKFLRKNQSSALIIDAYPKLRLF